MPQAHRNNTARREHRSIRATLLLLEPNTALGLIMKRSDIETMCPGR